METTAAGKGQSSSKIRLNTVAFLLATLLFLLPFVDIKCNEQKFASNTGVGLAFGINYKTRNQIKTDEGNFNKKISITEKQTGKLYVAALIALLLGLAGLLLSIVNTKPNKIIALIGLSAALALVFLMIQIQYDVRNKPGHEITEGLSDLKVTAQFTAWYYLSLFSFIVAAFFSYRQKPVVISN